MRTLAAISALLIVLAGCSPAPAPEPAAPLRDPGQDLADVVAAHRMLVQAYRAGDTDTFVGLLDPSPQLLVFHPFLQNRFDGIEKVRSAAPAMFARLGQSQWTDVHPSAVVEGDVAWLTGQVLIEPAGRDRPFVGRGTEIWVRRETSTRRSSLHTSRSGAARPAGLDREAAIREARSPTRRRSPRARCRRSGAPSFRGTG
jgi:ketosteroid isomerase-like protein